MNAVNSHFFKLNDKVWSGYVLLSDFGGDAGI
jgi:hypothetical protein